MLQVPKLPKSRKHVETINFHGVEIPIKTSVSYYHVAKVAKEYGFGVMRLGSDGKVAEYKLKVGQWVQVAFQDESNVKTLTYRLDRDWPVEIPADFFEEVKVEEYKEVSSEQVVRSTTRL